MFRHHRWPLFGLLTGTAVSALGTRMSAVALPWFVLVTSGSIGRAGLVAFFEMTPYVLVSAIGGPLIDRIGALRSAVVGNVAGGVVVGTIPLLHSLGSLHFPVLLGLVTGAGLAWGFASAGERVLLPGAGALAGTPMERVAGFSNGLNQLALMLGAPLAAAVLVFASAPVVLAFDAVSFVLCGLLILLTVPRAAEPEVEPTEHAAGTSQLQAYVADLRFGFAWLARRRLLLGICMVVLLTNMLDQALFAVLLPGWVQQETGDPADFGTIITPFALGALAGNALISWLGPRLPRRRIFAWSFLIAGAPRFIVLALAPGLPAIVVVMAIAGVAGGGLNPILGAVQYERIPRHLQARVLNAITALALAGIPLGSLLAGWSAGTLGITTTLGIAAVIYLLATSGPFLFPSWRGMERDTQPAEPEAVRADD